MAEAVASAPASLRFVRRLTWRRPEWPWVLLAGGSWVVLILEGMHHAEFGAHEHGHAMAHSMGSSMSMGPSPGAHHAHHHQGLSAAGLGMWSLMTVAMMTPAVLPIVREISLHSLWPRRYRAAAIFLVGYVAVWLVFGAVALAAWSLVSAPTSSAATFVTGAALLAAAGWGLTPAKRRRLKRCHRYLPLAPRGRGGDRTCLRFGVYHARQCVGVCGPVMLAMVPGHALISMLGLTALVTWERLARLPRLRITAVIIATVGLIALLVAAHQY